MAFEIYLKKQEGNEINAFLDIGKKVTVQNYTITNGLLEVGNYKLPIDNILFIKEI